MLPAVGYSDPNQSHFTSRHFWEVGATQAELLTGWMGRYLDLAGSPGNPLQGLCLDEALQPALATARMPVATIDTPASYSFYAKGVWGPPQAVMYDYFDALGEVGARSGDAAMAQSGGAALMSSTLRRQLTPFQPAAGAGKPALPAGYPSGGDQFPLRMAGIAQLLGGGTAAPLRERLHRNRCSTPTTTRSRRSTPGSIEAAQTLNAFQRDLESRGLGRQGADARLVGVRPAPARECVRRHRPRRGRLCVRDGHAGRRQDDRRVAGPRHAGSTRWETCGRPRTSGACTARCSSNGSDTKPRRSFPAASGLARPQVVR